MTPNAQRMMDRLQSYPEKYSLSDLHIRAGGPFCIRSEGEIISFAEDPVTAEEVLEFTQATATADQYEQFLETGDLDYAVQAGEFRYRVNVLKTIRGPAMVMRLIVAEVPHIDKLGLPPAVHKVLSKKAGLVLVTGQTGSGKSTSLAAMIDKINRERNEHIITIEDPVEFVHQDKKSIISQREVGAHTDSFAAAIKGALREDPDIILMGEMRDLETISMALTAAETGHLVFGTLHSSSAPSTITRLIDAFPPEQQEMARGMIAGSIQLVLSQRLLKRKGGGRVGCHEVMVATSAIRNLIREDKIPQMPTVMQTGAQYGMFTMEKCYERLVSEGLVE